MKGRETGVGRGKEEGQGVKTNGDKQRVGGGGEMEWEMQTQLE